MKSFRISGLVIYLFLFVIGVLLYLNYVYVPLNQKIDELNIQHATDEMQITQLEMQLARVDVIRDNVAELEEKLALAKENGYVIAEDAADDVNQAFLLNNIQPLSVTLSDVEPDKSGYASSDGQPLSTLKINLSFQSDQQGLLNLLDYFEMQSKGAYYVDTLSYSAGEAGIQAMSLNLILYFFPQAEATS